MGREALATPSLSPTPWKSQARRSRPAIDGAAPRSRIPRGLSSVHAGARPSRGLYPPSPGRPLKPTPGEPCWTLAKDSARLEKLKYRAWRRGFREADLILGPFADRHVAEIDAPQLDDFAHLQEAT